MHTLDRTLATLEKDAGFSQAFERIVARQGGWDCQWMTAEQINRELTQRGFWAGRRQGVLREARPKIVARYLDTLIDPPLSSGESWADAGGSSLHGPPKDSGWRRFDGQYKRNPRTKLIDPQAPKMSRGFDRRNYQRVAVRGVTCQYGPVLDLSRSGLMFTNEKQADIIAGQHGYLRIKHGDTALRLRVKCMWVHDIDQGARVGVEFRQVRANQQSVIDQILDAASEQDGDLIELH